VVNWTYTDQEQAGEGAVRHHYDAIRGCLQARHRDRRGRPPRHQEQAAELLLTEFAEARMKFS